MMRKSFITISLLLGAFIGIEEIRAQGRPSSYFNKSEMSVICKEPLPVFSLDGKTIISNKKAESLCSCIWNKFPENGWERQDALKVFRGESLGGNTGTFGYRFEKALKACGGYELLPNEIQQNLETQGKGGYIGLRSQQFFGFIGGGPLGIWASPFVYKLTGGNIFLWLIVGGIGGGFLWGVQFISLLFIFSKKSSGEEITKN